MDITAAQIRIDKFNKKVEDFKKLFNKINEFFKTNLKLDEEDLSYKNDLQKEFIPYGEEVGFSIMDFGHGIFINVFNIKYYPATREEPEDCEYYDECSIDGDDMLEALIEFHKRRITFNINNISEEMAYFELEESILDDN